MDTKSNHRERVQEYFDQGSERYASERYTAEYRDCHQFSYLARRVKVLDLLGDEGGNLLDVGCGPGVYIQDLLDRGCGITACDISPMMIDQARTRFQKNVDSGSVHFQVGDIHELDAEPESFDAAICIGVMAYVPDDYRFLQKLASLLKPGGCVVIQFSKKYSPKSLHEQYIYPFLTRTKSILIGRKNVEERDFSLRGYCTGQFNRTAASCGLHVEAAIHFDYTLPLLSSVATRFNLRLAELLERRRRGLLRRILAGDYVARYRKPVSDDPVSS